MPHSRSTLFPCVAAAGARKGIAVASLLLAFGLTACDGDGEPASLQIDSSISIPTVVEPSGIVVHPTRGTLFVVGDEGDLAEVEFDGSVVQQRTLDRGSLEGITVDPATGHLYVVFEGDDDIVEFAAEGLQALRRFAVERQFAGETVLAPPLPGLEGLSFRPDGAHPHGGTFYLVNQGAPQSTNDAAAVLEIVIPLRDVGGGTAVVRAVHRLEGWDYAGLVYDPRADRFLVVGDGDNLLLDFGVDGRTADRWPLPGSDQEGIALDGDGRLYVAQESGAVLVLSWNR